jgi:hypothetical protein
MDVKFTFLNGDLAEEVYVVQPLGFAASGKEGMVFRLHRTLYGLQQASRAWNSNLNAYLCNLGFTRCKTEHGLYARSTADTWLVIAVYVDDLLIVSESLEEIGRFKEQMKQIFHVSDLGNLSYYLGIEVKQLKHGIQLCQSAYATELLNRVDLGSCSGCAAPMDSPLKLSKRSSSPLPDATTYRSLIESLWYLLHTRPDLSFSVGYLSHFMAEPPEDHMVAQKHPWRYVAMTTSYELWYTQAEGEFCLMGYSDNNLAGDIDYRRSTTGVLFFLSGNPMSWMSQKQKAVTKSSSEAKYMPSVVAASQVVWLRRVLEEVIGVQVPVPAIKMDNTAAIAIARNQVLHEHSKHIDVKFHFTKECVERGDINLEHIKTGDEHADIPTKALGRVQY